MEGKSEFDGFELKQVGAGGHRFAVATVLFAGLAVAPVLVILFRGPGGHNKVAALALDWPEQLKALESRLAVDSVRTGRKTLFKFGTLSLRDVDCVDLYDRHGWCSFLGWVGAGQSGKQWLRQVSQADPGIIEAGGPFAGRDSG